MARWQRRVERARRPAPIAAKPVTRAPAVRVADEPRRLVYTRSQAAEALGISPTTFTRRVLPLIETVEMPWGARYVPVDELERLVKDHLVPAPGRPAAAPLGRPPAIPDRLVRRIRTAHANGASLRQIARDLNATSTPTAHGGAQWWPSTVRAVLRRGQQAPGRVPRLAVRSCS
jgi:hypothetical protein